MSTSRIMPSVKRALIHRCQGCGRSFPHGYTPRCPACGGLVDVLYDLGSTRLYDSDVSLERFFDLLPIRDPAHLLPLGNGRTPCVRAGALGESIGLDHLYLKVESKNPTGTTKDRMAAVVLSMFHELALSEFVSSSTGNSSSALSYAIARHPRFRMHLFVGEAFRGRVRFSEGNPGVVLHVMNGLPFTETFNHARDEARRLGLPFEGGFFNPARREGLKLAYLEAVDQVPGEIDWYFQAVSSAMGVHGTWKGAKELLAIGRIARPPRMVCVQQESCCPMVRAYEEGSPVIREHHIVRNPSGIAQAILRGDPSGSYPYVYQMVRESGGTFVRVSEAEIHEGQARLQGLEGIACGYCGAATIAAAAKLVRQGTLRPDETVLLNLTD